MPDQSSTRRFIAGAVCPRCAEMDRIVVDSASDRRECVACGYTEERPAAPVDPVPTRVTRPAARRIETPAEAVTLLDRQPPTAAAADTDTDTDK